MAKEGRELEVLSEEIELPRRFVELCHRHGIRVELYAQFGTLQ